MGAGIVGGDVALGFLNLGTSEVALLLVLLVLFFGAEKIPQLARSLGKARAEMERARREVQASMRSEEERALEDQLKFERAREAQIASTDAELAALRRAAEELGIETGGRTREELRAAIAERVGQ